MVANRIKPRDSRNLFFRDGFWWLDVQIKGQRFREKAGATEVKARDYRDKLRSWVRDSDRGLPTKKPEGVPLMFSEFAKDYLVLHARKKKSSDRDELSVGHLKDFFRGWNLKDINAEAVDRYRADRTKAMVNVILPNGKKGKRPLSQSTVNRELACLRSILYLAVRYGKLKAYPLPTKKLLQREPEFKPRILEVEEAERLVGVADKAFLRDAIIVYLGTGLRKRELLGLPRADVDFRRKELTITAERAKNGKARTIPLAPQVVEVLATRPGKEFFFENPKTGRPIDQIDYAWRTAKNKAGIKGRLRLHDLRDTFATWRLRAGVDIRTVSELIGDSPEITLRRYCHSDARTKRAAVAEMPDLLGGCRHKVPACSRKLMQPASESVS